MEDSVFTKIIKGQIPAHKVYEDDRTLAFLTIEPIQPGHTLIVPKAQVDHLWDLLPEDYVAVNETAQKVALRLREVMGTARVGSMVVGVDVPHAHVHLVPINTSGDLKAPENKNVSNDELARIAALLRF